MSKPTSTLGKFLSGLGKLYRGFRSVVLNLIFIFLLLVFVASLIGQPPVIIQRGSALLVNPEGVLVDQLTFVEPLNALVADTLDQDITDEVLLHDLLDAIDYAVSDDDISSIVLVTGGLQPSGFSKLQEVGNALERFRASGKRVYAFGDSYTQGQYYLAAHADEVILNTMGSVDLEGFSTWQYYYRDALDKLGVNVHIFRVGEYKSAVEPYERNDMSIEAREANSEWLGDLWRQYVNDVAGARNLEPAFFNNYINNLDQELAQYNGDMTALVLDRNLVDRIMDRGTVVDYLKQQIGTSFDNEDFLNIDYQRYLRARATQINDLEERSDKIGIIVASGTIYDGLRPAGEIGGDSIQQLIHQARNDDEIKALVLRIDSGGGSAFASEIIRNELANLKADGKPVVVSMGSLAASGGYWIATPADEIWASASTITGSIGIFGLYPTFSESFAKLGINADGIGTTDMAGALTVGRELPELAENVLQLTLEDGYNRFINLVAESRNMSLAQVDAIARGRVWSGEDALDLGLVDNLGSLDDAITAAAGLANLENYSTRIIEMPLTPGQKFFRDLTDNVTIKALMPHNKTVFTAGNMLGSFTRVINSDLQALLKFNDPKGLYLLCQECMPALSP